RRGLLTRGFFRKPIISVVEHGQHIAFARGLSDVDSALRDLAADSKCVVDFMPRLNGADVSVRFTGAVVVDFESSHGARDGSRLFLCAARNDRPGSYRNQRFE